MVINAQGSKNESCKNELLQQKLEDKAIVLLYKSTFYINILNYEETYMIAKLKGETIKTTLKWVQIEISNAKRTLLGILHKIRVKYL